MKHLLLGGLVAIVFLGVSGSGEAAEGGRVTKAFENTRPEREETAFGRLAADALREATRADIALVNAGALRRGTLEAGIVNAEKINALLAYPNDEIETLSLSGAQLRAALERAVAAYPTNSTAFLHASGLTATFDPHARANERLTSLRVGGREVDNTRIWRVAMPASLAQGSGYFVIWNGDDAVKSGQFSGAAIATFIAARGEVAPDLAPRIASR